MTCNRTFGEATEALKDGKRVSRAGWNGIGMFVFRQVPSEIPAEVIPNMTSLPPFVKAEFARRAGSIRYDNQLALVKPNNEINGWSPSVADTLADDWYILD